MTFGLNIKTGTETWTDLRSTHTSSPAHARQNVALLLRSAGICLENSTQTMCVSLYFRSRFAVCTQCLCFTVWLKPWTMWLAVCARRNYNAISVVWRLFLYKLTSLLREMLTFLIVFHCFHCHGVFTFFVTHLMSMCWLAKSLVR